jgi:hypothetical protein
MSKLVKIAIIIGTAVLLIAAKQTLPLYSAATAVPSTAGLSIAPMDMMQSTGELPHTQVDSYH